MSKELKSTNSNFILILLGNTQFVVTFLTIISVLYLHSAHAAYFSVGTLVSAFSAKVLKKFIKQPRPVGATKFTKTYGMPSTHSSSIAFFGTYLSLSTILLPIHPRIYSILPFWKYFDNSSTNPQALLVERIVRGLFALMWIVGASSVCWSRIKLGHHTLKQVLVGATLGSIVAITWLSLWLGLEEVGSLTHLGKFWETIVESKNLPSILLSGFQELGLVYERVIEDSIFLIIEAYKEGNWELLKDLKGVSLLGLIGKDEL